MNIPYAFKKCTKCGEWLVANNYNFYKQKNGKWGLSARCKKCHFLANFRHFSTKFDIKIGKICIKIV